MESQESLTHFFNPLDAYTSNSWIKFYMNN